MSSLLKREADLKESLQRMTQGRDLQAEQIRDTEEPAWIAGADVRWHRWIDQRRSIINAELAQVRALQYQQRSKMALAFGKQQVILSLNKQEIASSKLKFERRKDYKS